MKTRPPKAPKHLDVYLHVIDAGSSADRKLDQILAQLNILQTKVDTMAATVTDIKNLVAAIDNETNAVAAKVDAQTAAIQDLKDKLAAGGSVSQADLDAIKDGLEPISARLTAIGADASNPIPPNA